MFPTVTAFLTHLKSEARSRPPRDHRVGTRRVWSEEIAKVLSLKDASRARCAKEIEMPFINVKVVEGVFDAAQKRKIVERLTDAMVAIEGENMRSVTWCVVDEVCSGDWGIGGEPLSTTDVKNLAAGRAAAR